MKKAELLKQMDDVISNMIKWRNMLADKQATTRMVGHMIDGVLRNISRPDEMLNIIED